MCECLSQGPSHRGIGPNMWTLKSTRYTCQNSSYVEPECLCQVQRSSESQEDPSRRKWHSHQKHRVLPAQLGQAVASEEGGDQGPQGIGGPDPAALVLCELSVERAAVGLLRVVLAVHEVGQDRRGPRHTTAQAKRSQCG